MKQLRSAIVIFGSLTLIAGVLYPLVVTVLAQAFFPYQANGSVIVRGGVILGSELIGQPFDDPKYFWGRPSATSPFPYNAAASSGSNLGPLNPALFEAVKTRIIALQQADPGNSAPIPIDLVTTSASGLDPNISIAAALYQVARIARTRGLPEGSVRSLVEEYRIGRTLGFIGEPRVNVLQLNIALDGIK